MGEIVKQLSQGMLTKRGKNNTYGIRMLKKEKNANLLLWVTLSIPPTFLILASLMQAQLPEYSLTSRGILYLSFVAIPLILLLTVALFLKGKIKTVMFAQAIGLSLLYTSLPIAMVVKVKQENKFQIQQNFTRGTTLRTLLFSEPHYSMGENEIKKLLDSTRNIPMGRHYTEVLKLLPPVPDGCPIIMKTLETKEIILVYFIKKLKENAEIGAGDKHITLTFDEEQNLLQIKEVI